MWAIPQRSQDIDGSGYRDDRFRALTDDDEDWLLLIEEALLARDWRSGDGEASVELVVACAGGTIPLPLGAVRVLEGTETEPLVVRGIVRCSSDVV